MARTTAGAVQSILGDHYGPKEDGSLPSLTPFIDTATVMVSRVATCATEKGIALSSAELELIERWLAAHFYEHSDQMTSRDETGEALAVFQGKTGMYLESTKYGQTALLIDYSGCLAGIQPATDDSTGRRVLTVDWLGRPPSEQTEYSERD